MDRTKIAIPCTGEANLQSQVSPHFGRCDSYAIVTVEDGQIKAIESVWSRAQSECAGSAKTLVENGVRLMLVGAMGMRPYLFLKELGIEVRRGITGTVAEAIESYLKGQTSPMAQEDLCGCHNTDGPRCQE